ncbi:hypothetical protein [Rhizobium lentis]|uniref:hypothetical protein n=1 Tax=Rhizobium lentis TaxID=1138194 RepID=UPI001C83F5CE|nr:hypothetical protein [Rhizobium lentis]MBX5112676.1 hypothetical protein [Rhizobium lentis]
MGIRIDELNPTSTPSTDHKIAAMKDGQTVYLLVAQILGLIDNATVQAAIAAAMSDNSFDDTDEAVYLSGSTVKRGTISGLISSIFKTARTIANAQFASASFKLFNAAGTPRALMFNTTALTADRALTLPDASVTIPPIIQSGWTEIAPVATTSGSAIDWPSIPANVTDIELWFNGVSVSGTDSLVLQLGTGGTQTTSGYVSGSGLAGSNSGSFRIAATNGLALFTNTATYAATGRLSLHRTNGNTWISDHSMLLDPSAGTTICGGGSIALGGPLDNIRLTRQTGAQTFDAGSVQVRYR